MYKPLVKLLLITTVVITLASCGSKTPKETKYIPKDATAVVVVNPKSLEDKMKTGNLSLDSFVNKFNEKEDTANQAKAKKLWDDFKASGVSLDDNLFLFVVQKGNMQKGQSTAVSVLATIKDEAKFEAYVKKQQEQLKDNGIQKESNFSYLSF
jgi:predicted small lipoprotein YifL